MQNIVQIIPGGDIRDFKFDHRRIISASGDGTVKVWDLRTGNLVRTLGGSRGWISKIYLREEVLVICSEGSGKRHEFEVSLLSYLLKSHS